MSFVACLADPPLPRRLSLPSALRSLDHNHPHGGTSFLFPHCSKGGGECWGVVGLPFHGSPPLGKEGTIGCDRDEEVNSEGLRRYPAAISKGKRLARLDHGAVHQVSSIA